MPSTIWRQDPVRQLRLFRPVVAGPKWNDLRSSEQNTVKDILATMMADHVRAEMAAAKPKGKRDE